MATISRHGKGWRVQVRRRGHPVQSATFPLKKQAEAWAAQRESDIIQGKLGVLPKHTLLEALEKYASDVSPKHKGARWELVRLKKIGRHPLALKQIASVTATDLSAWRDEQPMAAASVRREMGLLSQVFDVARREWKWINTDPMKDVDRPSGKRAGIPRPLPLEAIWSIVGALGAPKKSRETALAFLFGVETAMRPTEIFSLELDQVDFATGVAHLSRTKNGDERDVPLSMLAQMWLLELLWMNGRERFFTVTADSASTLWRDARAKTPHRSVHFRHARREGISRLSKRLDILELARAVGHRNLNSLMIYYTSSAADMARKLD